MLGGGRSSEHEISLASAESVRAGLAEGGPRARGGAARARRALDARGRAVRWSPAGGLLGADVGVPGRCTGRSARTARSRGCSSCSTCPTWAPACRRRRVAMDKSLFKDLLAAHGVPQVDYAAVRERRRRSTLGALGLPLFVKPARLGLVGRDLARRGPRRSSTRRWRRPSSTTRVALVERLVDGIEVECSVLGHSRPDRLAARARSSLAARELVRLRGQVRAGRDGADRPGSAAGAALETVRELAVEVFTLVGCSGMARVDFFVEDGPRARERAEHDPGLHRDERVREAARGRRASRTSSCWTGWWRSRWSATESRAQLPLLSRRISAARARSSWIRALPVRAELRDPDEVVAEARAARCRAGSAGRLADRLGAADLGPAPDVARARRWRP